MSRSEPLNLPLEIDRRVRTLPGGGADTVVVEEAVTYRIADTAQQERHHYVVDRRSMQHRDDERNWSFAPENRIRPAGTYRVTLPLGMSADGRYRIWENEPGRSFWMVRDPARARVRQNGLGLVGLQEVWDGVPVAPYYRTEIEKQGQGPFRAGRSREHRFRGRQEGQNGPIRGAPSGLSGRPDDVRAVAERVAPTCSLAAWPREAAAQDRPRLCRHRPRSTRSSDS